MPRHKRWYFRRYSFADVFTILTQSASKMYWARFKVIFFFYFILSRCFLFFVSSTHSMISWTAAKHRTTSAQSKYNEWLSVCEWIWFVIFQFLFSSWFAITALIFGFEFMELNVIFSEKWVEKAVNFVSFHFTFLFCNRVAVF